MAPQSFNAKHENRSMTMKTEVDIGILVEINKLKKKKNNHVTNNNFSVFTFSIIL